VGFDVDVKCLRLQLAVRRVIHSGNRLCRRQVVQILCELAEFSARAFLLPDLLLSLQLLRVRVKYFAHICVLVLHVLQVLFASKEIVLVLATVVASIIFLDYGRLLREEFDSAFHLDSVERPARDKTALVAAPRLLDKHCLALNVLEAPLVPEHAPVSLDAESCEPLLLTKLLCFY